LIYNIVGLGNLFFHSIHGDRSGKGSNWFTNSLWNLVFNICALNCVLEHTSLDDSCLIDDLCLRVTVFLLDLVTDMFQQRHNRGGGEEGSSSVQEERVSLSLSLLNRGHTFLLWQCLSLTSLNWLEAALAHGDVLVEDGE